MEARTFCSQINPAEPLAGTADPVGAWVLLEYRPAWKSRAHDDNTLPPRVREWLAQQLAALALVGIRARPQFVRRPDHDEPGVRLLLARPDQTLMLHTDDHGAFAELDLVGLVREPTTAPMPAGIERGVVTAPLYFVCTNGQRDVCCARYGLPVYHALAQAVGPRAWQITHLGGHRFAPNVLVLPQGGVYGRVTPAVLPEFVAAIESGHMAFAQLRGRSFYPAHVQAAEALSGRNGLRLLFVEGDPAEARVRFAVADETLEIGVRRATDALRVLTSCGADAPEPVHPFERV